MALCERFINPILSYNIIHFNYICAAGILMGKENAVETEMLNIRLPEDIIRWLDSLVESGIYSSRSEAIRDFLRDFVLQSDGEGTGK
jgi:hypothetical protein